MATLTSEATHLVNYYVPQRHSALCQENRRNSPYFKYKGFQFRTLENPIIVRSFGRVKVEEVTGRK